MASDRHGRALHADGDRRRRPSDGFRVRDARRFARLVEDVVETLPRGLLEAVADAEIVVEDVPGADAARQVALARFDPAAVPPRLTVYRRPLESRAWSREELDEVVRTAVGREVARALGVADDFPDDSDEPPR
ncbi:MAG TPA: metallopeptidase family protein [Egibacteraceae bacterium]|nr:metallopeptidase family protein [Egibacteraceae bacterium]